MFCPYFCPLQSDAGCSPLQLFAYREGSSRPRTVACLGSRSPEFSNWSFLTAGPQEPTVISNKSDVIGIRYKYHLVILDIFGRELAAQLALSLIATLPFGSEGRGVGQSEIPLTPAPAYICILFVAEIRFFSQDLCSRPGWEGGRSSTQCWPEICHEASSPGMATHRFLVFTLGCWQLAIAAEPNSKGTKLNPRMARSNMGKSENG